MADVKPTVLILGGCGFIGRNLVKYLVSNDLASKIRVVDKVMPALAWLNPTHTEAFSHIEFKHANLINPSSVTNAFSSEDNSNFDYVINCAGETKLGQSEAVYKDGIYKLSCNCAQEAARRQTKCYVEVSEARMKASEKVPIKEDTDCEPWTAVARYKLQVEQYLASIPDLNYVILRPALVYGIADKTGLTRRMVVAGVYKYLQETLQMLWSKELYMNTLHVHDMVRAVWHVCMRGETRHIYHLADKGNTNQGKIGDIVSEIFNINYDYISSMSLNLAKIQMTLEDIAEEVNEKHVVPWGEACLRAGINNTPLTPVVAEEHLAKKDLHVDGSKIESIGFVYERPGLTKELLKEVLDDYIAMKLFPASLLS